MRFSRAKVPLSRERLVERRGAFPLGSQLHVQRQVAAGESPGLLRGDQGERVCEGPGARVERHAVGADLALDGHPHRAVHLQGGDDLPAVDACVQLDQAGDDAVAGAVAGDVGEVPRRVGRVVADRDGRPFQTERHLAAAMGVVAQRDHRTMRLGGRGDRVLEFEAARGVAADAYRRARKAAVRRGDPAEEQVAARHLDRDLGDLQPGVLPLARRRDLQAREPDASKWPQAHAGEPDLLPRRSPQRRFDRRPRPVHRQEQEDEGPDRGRRDDHGGDQADRLPARPLHGTPPCQTMHPSTRDGPRGPAFGTGREDSGPARSRQGEIGGLAGLRPDIGRRSISEGLPPP